MTLDEIVQALLEADEGSGSLPVAALTPPTDEEFAEMLYKRITPTMIWDAEKRQQAIGYALDYWRRRGRKDTLSWVITKAILWAKDNREFRGTTAAPVHRRVDPLDPDVQKRYGLAVQSLDAVDQEGSHESDEAAAVEDEASLALKRDLPDEAARKRIDWDKVYSQLSSQEREDFDDLTRGREARKGNVKIRGTSRQRIADLIRRELPDYVPPGAAEARVRRIVNALLN